MKKHLFIIPLLFLSYCAQAATISWSSTNETVGKNATFALDIIGYDFVTDVNGGGANFTFDPNVINVVSVSIDESVWEFGSTGTNTGTIDNVAGTVNGIMVNTFKGVTGNFIVATVNFQTIGIDGSSTDLTLSELTINPWASSGNMINPAFIHGNITVTIDSDDDGINDTSDNCSTVSNVAQTNTDGDTEGDACDADDDNDGLTDTQEITLGTNPLLIDTDADSVNDNIDAFPTDITETADTDGDSVGDNADAFPSNIAASVDVDNDGKPEKWNADCDASCQNNSGLTLDGSGSDGGGGSTNPLLLVLLSLLAIRVRRRAVI